MQIEWLASNTAVPARAIVVGAPGTLLAIEMMAVRPAGATGGPAGVKVTLMGVDAPGLTVSGNWLEVSAKSPAFVPVTVKAVMISGDPPVLLRLMFFAALAVLRI